MKKVEIIEKQITKVATLLWIDKIDVSLDKNCRIDYRLSSSNELIKVGVYTLTEAEYSAWGNDDSYIVNIICEKEGLTLA